MRVYVDLDENIDNISELHAYIKTRDDKYIKAGGDIELWAMEKTSWIPVSEMRMDMKYIDWLKEQIDSLNDIQDDFRYGMLKAFELCLEKYEESEDKE